MSNIEPIYYIGGFFIALFIVVVIIASMKLSIVPKSESWGTKQGGMGVYMGPLDNAEYSSKTYNSRKSADVTSMEVILNKWYTFVNMLSSELASELYNLYPTLQTPESIQYYGLDKNMIKTLTRIEPKLINPTNIKTLDDLNRIFSKDAVDQLNIELKTKPMSGLYNTPTEYGLYQSVY